MSDLVDPQVVLNHLTACVPGVIYTLRMSADGQISMPYASGAVIEVFGLNPEEISGDFSKLEALIHPQDLEPLKESVRESARNLTPWRLEWRILHPAKGEIWLEGRSLPVSDERGICWHGYIQDITERKNSSEALRGSEEKFRRIVEAEPECVKILDSRGQLLEMNPAGLAMIEADSLEQVRAQQVLSLIKPEYRAAFAAMIKDVFRGESRRLVFEIEGLKGGHKWLESHSVPLLDSQNRATALLSITRDITERKQAEENQRKLEAQMQHAQKLESLGVLAGGIAHDFNNILTSILGFADLARRALTPDSRAFRYIQEVVKGAEQASELTQQMLAYSGKGRFVIQPLNISALVEDMSKLLEVSISKKALLKYCFSKDLPSVEADASQMRQVIMNLIINASEALGDSSGIITVSTGLMHCNSAYLSETYLDEKLPEGDYVFLEVTDTGCGMSKETLSKVFDPFFTTKFTGRGLGLAALLGIVRGHRGAVKVYSELGKGTTFKVLFPASHSPAQTGSALEVLEEWRGSGILLVVDDEAVVRNLASEMLQSMGFQVLTAKDGEEAVELFRSRAAEIRLVLLDMTMPRMDGEATFLQMRKIRGDVKAILSSGYNEQTATARFVGRGLAGFIQKPYRYDALQAVVRRVLES